MKSLPRIVKGPAKEKEDIKPFDFFAGFMLNEDAEAEEPDEETEDADGEEEDEERIRDEITAAENEILEEARKKAAQIIFSARDEGRRILVLAGRPYHVDPEINHGIDMLINSFGVSVISEDSISHLVHKFPVRVLNQWMYHARLYAAAKYVCTQPDMELVQLVSFGCGLDAITTDEVRSIIEKGGKIYTQIKIDEITNLGAVRVRLRSLLAALDRKKGRSLEGNNASATEKEITNL